MTDYTPQRTVFHNHHQSGCFVMPNPWDAGTTRYLQQMGFQAVATTSAGFAFSRGLPDRADVLTREMVLAHIADIVAATDLPVNADYQSGYTDDAEGVAESVRQCIATGVAGLSIEVATGNADKPLYEISEAVNRIRAAREAIDVACADEEAKVLLTGRAECFLVNHPDALNESIKRLQAYADAGADVLYAPGPTTREDIRAIIESVSPKPVNILMSNHTGLTVTDLAELGARRISVGSALARSAWAGFLHAAKQIADEGNFAALTDATPFSELNAAFDSHSPQA